MQKTQKISEYEFGTYKDPTERIEVIISDIFALAVNLVRAGKRVCLLNFTSNDKPCVSTRNENTQEEILFRISDIGHELEDKLYPIDGRTNEGIKYEYDELALLYTPNVQLHSLQGSDNKLSLLDVPIKVDVITCASIENPRAKEHISGEGYDYCYESDRDITLRKIQMILSCAISSECDILLLGAWGCEMFNNPIHGLVDLWAEALKKYPLDHVIFPINSTNRYVARELMKNFKELEKLSIKKN